MTGTADAELRGARDSLAERADVRRRGEATPQGVASAARRRQRPRATPHAPTQRRLRPAPATDPQLGAWRRRPLRAAAALTHPDAAIGHRLHRLHDEHSRPVSHQPNVIATSNTVVVFYKF